MVLIYSHTSSPRLQYITNFIFKTLLGTDYRITIDSEEFINAPGVKINYNNDPLDKAGFHIVSHTLLFENGIKEQNTRCVPGKDYPVFYTTEGGDLRFDIFAASFYLLSRYEEYLPHHKDIYGRYAHGQSLAFKSGFLNVPLINTWVNGLASHLKESFPGFEIHPPVFKFLPTYDIDIAYSFRHKGLLRNMGGFLKSPSATRLKVLTGLKADPYDCYEWLNSIHHMYRLEPVYFFLVADKNGRYDKNILPHKTAMWKLVKQHARQYRIGIHPSWQTGDLTKLLASEKEQLEAMGEIKITSSRQHYIRFNLPAGYRRLADLGITDDYSMGYGSINGFRASVANAFYWYDLEREIQTDLLIHPFCFMEANSFYEQEFTTAPAYDELVHYFKVCKKANGTLITIWHNNFLGTSPEFAGWKEIYERFIGSICADVGSQAV